MQILALTIEQANAIDFGSLARKGFEACLVQGFQLFSDPPLDVAPIAEKASAAGLKLLFDVELDAFPMSHPLVNAEPEAFSLRRGPPAEGPVDPRNAGPGVGWARARLGSCEAAKAVLPVLMERLADLGEVASGFRLWRADSIAPEVLHDLLSQLKEHAPDLLFIAQTPGIAREKAKALTGFDWFVSSFSFWNGKAAWLAEEYEALRMTAPLLAEVTEDALRHASARGGEARLLELAAATSNGLILPAEALDLADNALDGAHGLVEQMRRFDGEMRFIPAGQVTAILRADGPDLRGAGEATLVLANVNDDAAAIVREHDMLSAIGANFTALRRAKDTEAAFAPLAEGEVRPLFAKRARPIAGKRTAGGKAAKKAAASPRLIIEALSPDIDHGKFPAKRVIGDVVTVEANIFADGHEKLLAELRWRAIDEKEWQAVRMEALGNDRWRGEFPLERLGRYEYVIEGWLDVYGGFRSAFSKKFDAGVAEKVDFMEGRKFIEQARKDVQGELEKALGSFLSWLNEAADEKAAANLLLDPKLALLMDEADQRPFSLTTSPRPVDAERLAARFSSWYELFPRSLTDDPARHGTFDDVIKRLPAIRNMGFDTLYFTPIHPIGRSHRKGRNNTLNAEEGDPGSPYAIGSEEGGHDALHPELGTIADFRRMVEAAQEHGLEIALDFAIQCSPDHPWLKERPGWFDWRPDGTLKYAENPPKKYQDIVNVDFYKDDAIPDLWLALRDVVLFWIKQGVKTFRVDNPHTKPFAFWEWMIADIRSVYPDAIFLSEAFTRPAVMYHLAKIGFSQSYTYFTWRNTKVELTEYLTELTTTDVSDYFRPHFFVNTPDINPTFLHYSGRPGFKIRAALAATLSGLFGVYSGFELCEAEPVPGKEEYWESEKYEIKPRDWQAPGNIIEDITTLNRVRRAYPALQSHLGLRFYNAWNDNILYYGKLPPSADDMVLIAVSLDPHNAQEADFEVPLWEWSLPDHGGVAVEDLITGRRFEWHGKVQHLRLTPDQPYALWHIAPLGAADV